MNGVAAAGATVLDVVVNTCAIWRYRRPKECRLCLGYKYNCDAIATPAQLLCDTRASKRITRHISSARRANVNP